MTGYSRREPSSKRTLRRSVAGALIGLFLLQIVMPPVAAATSAHVSAGEMWRRVPSFPSPPVGFQGQHEPRQPRFYAHHWPDPVNAHNGNLLLAYQDVFIPARGFPLELSRAYNSQSTARGVFGYGWSSSLDSTLHEAPGGPLWIRDWDGSIKVYRREAGGAGGSADTYFVPVAPSVEAVTKHRDGSYTRNLGNGAKATYSRTGKLLEKVDARGNGLTVSYDARGERLVAVADSAGRKVQLASTASGLVHTVIDPIGRRSTYRYDANDNLIGVTDPSGATTQYSYDSGHKLIALVQADGSRITNVYDRATGRVVAQEGPGRKRTAYQYEFPAARDATQRTVVTDALGNQTIYTYLEADGRVDRLTLANPAGSTTVAEYDALGNLVRHIDANGNRRTYEYDAQSRLLRQIDPVGSVWRYAYAAGCTCAHPTSTTDPLGQMTTTRYNDKFEVTEITNPLGQSTRFEYGPQGDVVAKIAPNGARTVYRYDAYGNLARTTSPAGTSTIYTRDTVGRITEVTRPGGERYRYQYDAVDRLVEIANALDYRVALAYDRGGRLSKILDQEGAFVFDYDAVGQLVALRDREGNTVRATYDTAGNVVQLVDGGGNAWTFAYDKMSRLTRAVDPLNQATSLRYDRAGNLVGSTNPTGETTTIAYDQNHRPIHVTDAIGNRTEVRYDPAGRRIAVIDAEQRETRYAYDAAGQLVASINALGQKMVYRYDARGKVVEQVDATGAITRLQYDEEGRLQKRIDPIGRATSYQYDAAGRVERVIRPDTHAIRFEYTPLGLPARIIPQEGEPITFAYDHRGQLTEHRAGEFAYRYKYNRMGRVTEVEDVKRKRVLRHAYDARHHRIRTELLPEGRRTDYAYDAASRLGGLKTDSGDYRFTYDAAGRRASLTYPNRLETSYGYDKAGRLSELLTVDPTKAVLLLERYEYDRVGSLVKRTGAGGEVTAYKFDPLDRLVEARHPDGATEAFTYDPMGNIGSRSGRDGVVHSQVNKAHEIVATGDTRFDYDANGNLIRRVATAGTTQYRYDDFNRLREATLPDGRSVSYAYGPDGQRVAEKRDGVETHTVYDGDNPMLKLDGQLRPTSTLTFGPGLDEALAETAPGTKRFFHGDIIRSVIASTDERGARASTVAYSAFGRPSTTAGTSPAFSFTGRPYDHDTGLLSFRFRDHDPALGRFLQQDPLEWLVSWQNPYVYAFNNPVNLIDLYGLVPAWLKAGLQVAGGVVLGVVGLVVLPLAVTIAVSGATVTAAGITGITAAGVFAGGVVMAAAGVSGGANYMQSASSSDPTKVLNTGIGSVTGGLTAVVGVATADAAAGAMFVSGAVAMGLGMLNSLATEGKPALGGLAGLGGFVAGLGTSTPVAAVIGGALTLGIGTIESIAGLYKQPVTVGPESTNNQGPVPTPTPPCSPSPRPPPSP
jgi:RHS repeat-associated protein